VIRGADDDGIHVRAREQVVVVRVPGDAVVGLPRLLGVVPVDEGLGVFDPLAVEVASGHDAGDVVLPDAGQVVPARDASGADGTHVDAVAGRRGAENGGGGDGGEARGPGGGGDPPGPRGPGTPQAPLSSLHARV